MCKFLKRAGNAAAVVGVACCLAVAVGAALSGAWGTWAAFTLATWVNASFIEV